VKAKIIVVSLLVLVLAVGAGATEWRPYSSEVPEIQVMTSSHDPVRYEMARMIFEMWSKLGLKTKFDPMTHKAATARAFLSKEFDTYVIHYGPRPARLDPYVFLYAGLHSSNAGPTGWGVSGFQNAEYDKLTEKQIRTLDIEKRQKLVYQAQEFVYKHQPHTVLLHKPLLFAYNQKTFRDPIVVKAGFPITNFWSNISFKPATERKVLRDGYAKPLKTLNPLFAQILHDQYILGHIYDKLFRIGPEGQPIPWAAEKKEIINDTTIDITIRGGMKFHDGKPVTAEDVKFSYEYMKEWKAPYYLDMLKVVEKIEIVGDRMLRFHFPYPYAPAFMSTFAEIPILPKHIWKDIPEKVGLKDAKDWENPHPIGSGPFKFDYWRPGEEYKLSTFKEHWTATVGKGLYQLPKVEGILWVTYKGTAPIVAALERGEIDRAGYYLTPEQIETLEKSGLTVVNMPTFGMYLVHYNCRKPPFNDMQFRRALSYAIDREMLNETLYGGMAQVGGSVIGPSNEFWHNPEIPPFPFDLEKAKQILKEAGYWWDAEGRLHYPKPENDKRVIDIEPDRYKLYE